MMIRKHVLGAACVVGAIGLFTVSCDKSNSATSAKDASVATGGAGTDGAGTGGSPAGGGGGGGGIGGMQSLYDKYGGAPTVAKVVDDAVGGVLADCQLAPYFAVVGTTGHDTGAELKSCLRLQFTALMGGPATYPGTNDEGDVCVDMKTIHTGLQIPGNVFDKFLMDLAGVLKTDGVTDADIATMATALQMTKTDIVSPTPVQKTSCPDATDAGTGDAAQSLYLKYGGAPTVAKVVDDAVAGVLMDCQLAPYFAVVGTAGHDTAAELKSCLRLQFTALMGGPATYPGVNDLGGTCVDMKTIHTGLQIPGAAFDRFIVDLGGVLKTDGVSDADIATLAGALQGTMTDIVSPTPVVKSSCDAGTGG
jgi:truncated hemoglobin YjbI